MASIEDIHLRQNAHIDAMVTAFEDELRKIVARASAKVTGHLQAKLSITDGVIDRTPANNRVLRQIDALFVREMKAAGSERLVEAFVGEFPGQLPFLSETVEALRGGNQKILPFKMTTRDLNVMASYQVNAIGGLESLVEGAAGYAIRGTLLSVGGLKFGDLVETLSEKFGMTLSRAKSFADTAMAVWYRTATDLAFQAIEDDLPEQPQEYKYTSGPDDKKTRPFCHSLIQAGKSYTRAEIAEMDNHQIPNVLISGGGFNCRHQWLLEIPGSGSV